jgi:hypothetical protein
MHAALGRRKLCLSEKVVQRLMKQECLIVTANKKRRYRSYLGEISPAPENLLNRDFNSESPNEQCMDDPKTFIGCTGMSARAPWASARQRPEKAMQYRPNALNFGENARQDPWSELLRLNSRCGEGSADLP